MKVIHRRSAKTPRDLIEYIKQHPFFHLELIENEKLADPRIDFQEYKIQPDRRDTPQLLRALNFSKIGKIRFYLGGKVEYNGGEMTGQVIHDFMSWRKSPIKDLR